MEKKIAVINGDGIGPEVTAQSIKVLNAIAEEFGHQFSYTHALMGAVSIDATGSALPDETLAVCKESDAILFGAIGHPKFDNDPSAKVRPEQGLLQLRKELGLFANIRPITTYRSLHHLSPLKAKQLEGVDCIIFRELTGGIYFGKRTVTEDKTYATDECAYHELEIVRVAKMAFQYAQQRRKKLTLIDKANVLETSRLWRRIVQAMAMQFPEVAVDYMFVDNAAMQIIVNPAQFDVILTENMFGDIISDEASVLSGSLGLLPSASIGKTAAMFEPIHGSWPQAKGLNIANPLAQILSVAMLFEYFDLSAEGAMIREAVDASLDACVRTPEIQVDGGEKYGTREVGAWIVNYIECKE